MALTLVAAMVLAACGGGSGDAPAEARQGLALAADMTAAEVPLTVTGATASDSEGGDLGPEKAVDHDMATRWSSGFSDDQSITLDFGQTQSPLRRVVERRSRRIAGVPALDVGAQAYNDGRCMVCDMQNHRAMAR